jgi:hypothetical protein
MKTITINLHSCSREEETELLEYLDEQCWDFKLNDSNKHILAIAYETAEKYAKKHLTLTSVAYGEANLYSLYGSRIGIHACGEIATKFCKI